MERAKKRKWRGEVEGGKWLHSSISKLHATLAFHPFSNGHILSKRWANWESKDWTAIFEGIVLTGSFVCVCEWWRVNVCMYFCVYSLCVCISAEAGDWRPTSLIFKALWGDLNNTHRRTQRTVVFKARSYHVWICWIYSDTDSKAPLSLLLPHPSPSKSTLSAHITSMSPL